MSSPIAQFHGLSVDEARVRMLRLVAQGWSIRQIAQTFMVSEDQVSKVVDAKQALSS